MKKIKIKPALSGILILLAQTVLLTAITLLCVVPFSCRVSEEGITFVGGDYVSPVLEEVTVVDERTVELCFSEKIKLRNYTVSEQLKELSDSAEHSETIELSPALKAASGGYGRVEADYSISEDGCVLTFFTGEMEQFEVGKAYELFGTVEDKAGNTLTYCVPFCGFNSHLPKLIITEVQVKYKKYKEDAFRCEYVELLALTEGNLSGLELLSAADGEGKKFVLPAVDVKAGEVLLVHLRSAGSGCITETENLNESTALYSGKNVRDIWSENTKARLSDNSDIVVVKNSVTGAILDAVMYATEDATEWGKGMLSVAEVVAAAGIYASADISEAEINSGLGSSAIKAFCRTDAAALQKKVLVGEDFSNLLEYPLQRTDETWVVKNVSPGTL